MKKFVTLFIICSISIAGLGQRTFNKDKQFVVINAKQNFKRWSITHDSWAKDSLACLKWKIPISAIPGIIRNSRQVEWITLDLGFEFSSCQMVGELLQNGIRYKYVINAGSWLSISGKDSTIFLGNFKKSDAKYFLSRFSNE